jgi:hypothetical protein
VFLVVGIFAGHWLGSSSWFTQVRYKLYPYQIFTWNQSSLHPRHTALVLLDDGDYWGDRFQARTPLKRDALAELISQLDMAGVNTVVLDVDLRSPHPWDPNFEFPDYTNGGGKQKGEDEQLFEAIQHMCSEGRYVVLASSVRFDQYGYHEMPSIDGSVFSPDSYCGKKRLARKGYIQLPNDMRQFPGRLPLVDDDGTAAGHLDSLPLAVVGTADELAYADAIGDSAKGFRFSEYLTEDDFRKSGLIYSGRKVEALKAHDPMGPLANRIVFIGANWSSYASGNGSRVDLHLSPGGVEPGVMLLANYVEAMLDRTGTFAPMSDIAASALEIGLAIFLGLVWAMEVHAGWRWGAAGFVVLLCIFLTNVLLQDLGLFLDFLVPLLVIVVHALIEELLGLRHKLQHAKHHSQEVRA